jgi:peptidoglycan/LPS O-acetylase OafA/YrhL
MTVTIVIPLFLFSAMHIDIEGRLRSLCRITGALSYPVYVLHVPIILLVTHGLKTYYGIEAAVFAPAAGFGVLGLSIIVSLLADKFYGRPFREMILRFSNKGSGGVTLGASALSGRQRSAFARAAPRRKPCA